MRIHIHDHHRSAETMSYPIDYNRRRLLGTAAMAAAAIPLRLFDTHLAPMTHTIAGHPGAEELASLSKATAWLNSPPLTAAGLRGKVVLVDVWTYTCINWLRTFPYVRAWAEKYKPNGLVVIGVHAPEFPFEREAGNVERAIDRIRRLEETRAKDPGLFQGQVGQVIRSIINMNKVKDLFCNKFMLEKCP